MIREEEKWKPCNQRKRRFRCKCKNKWSN